MSFPTSTLQSPLFFQNSRLSQSASGPCRISLEGASYSARIHHAEAGHQGEAEARRPRSHAHPVYHIVLVTGGMGQFRLGDGLIPVNRGTLVTTGPGEYHGFSRTKGENTCYAEVTFDFVGPEGRLLLVPFPEMLSLWAGEKGNCRPTQHLAEPATAELEQRIEHLVRVGRAPTSGLRLPLALLQVLESCHEATGTPATPAMPWEKAYRMLLEDFASPQPVTELAARLHVHPDYLTRRFRIAYGMAPLAFQNWLRIEAAKTWLISSDYSLKEIAARIGCADPGYFARLFRRKTGMAPGQFRRARRSA